MDLILGPWSDAHLATLGDAQLEVYELLLEENDQDLMSWILGQSTPPIAISGLLAEIGAYARIRLQRV